MESDNLENNCDDESDDEDSEVDDEQNDEFEASMNVLGYPGFPIIL